MPLRCHMDGRIYKSVEYHLVHLQFRYCITVESGIETRFIIWSFLYVHVGGRKKSHRKKSHGKKVTEKKSQEIKSQEIKSQLLKTKRKYIYQYINVGGHVFHVKRKQ